jgi:serine/threonine-protein kinase
MGTIDYLAPELIKGEAASPASDIYALGCTIYECVTGQAPFADKEGIAVGLAHVGEPPPDPREFRDDIGDAYVSALLTALAKEPEQRPRTASDYGRQLVEAVGSTA